ncbi:hypothetical protein DFJ74DRAFT_702404 [Hyaloraphidium curvatum]|nr:hypothetical protein DFJ74DRAFT_702404 [Hyaloraphidium curvatum]
MDFRESPLSPPAPVMTPSSRSRRDSASAPDVAQLSLAARPAPAASSALKITVGDAQKHGEGTDAYTTYRVDTKTTLLDHYNRAEFSVRRRFTDFVWLNTQLQEEFPACIVPPLPAKQRMESYITGSRFEPEFIARRTAQLQTYMTRVARHPTLQTSKALKLFLEANDLRAEGARKSFASNPVFENLSDTLLNAFSKLKKPDPRFGAFRESLDKLEENLSAVEKLHARLVGRERELQGDLAELGMCVAELSRMETGIAGPLADFGKALSGCAAALKERALQEDIGYVTGLHVYLAYCGSVREVLKLRDQKQLDYEDLQEYLTRTMTDRDRYSIPGRIGGGGLTGWVRGQYDEKIRGVDPERARLETLAKLERKIIELQEAVAQSNEVSQAFGDEVAKEIDFFQALKGSDFKEFLGDYATAQAEFYKKSMQLWDDAIIAIGNYTIEPLQQ